MTAPAVSPSRLVWIVFCEVEGCSWRRDQCRSREHARSLGQAHSVVKHDEYAYRVQGIRYGGQAPEKEYVDRWGRVHAPHVWQPHPKSRDKAQPCGRCHVYRYLHDDIYGVTRRIPGRDA